MDCSQPGQNFRVYAFREIGVSGFGAEVVEREHCDSLCYPDLLGGSILPFQRVQLIATGKASSDPVQKLLASFAAFARRPCDEWESCSTVLMSGRRERSLFTA